MVELTREMAIWLMTLPLSGKTRGLVVYVDAQLQPSARFDAEGIRADHPELFEPMPCKNTDEDTQQPQEGQLRYWTADMCSTSPYLADFVLTVRASTYAAWRRRDGVVLLVALPEHGAAGDPLFARLARVLDPVQL